MSPSLCFWSGGFSIWRCVQPWPCKLSTTNLHPDLLLRSQKSPIWSFLCHKAWPAKQNLFIQAIFKAARSFLCHKMSGEQILFYQGSPISGLGDEFARCGGWRQINQIEAWMINVTLKREKETSHLLKSFGDRKYLI